jgi:hypothetical protein
MHVKRGGARIRFSAAELWKLEKVTAPPSSFTDSPHLPLSHPPTANIPGLRERRHACTPSLPLPLESSSRTSAA